MTTSPDAILQLEGVSRTFAGHPSFMQWIKRRPPLTHAVRDVSLTVTRGKVLGVIGESGSGKSTLGFLIANLDQLSRGRILFHGNSITGMQTSEKREFRRKVQVIFQDSMASLNPRRRVVWAIKDSLRLAGVPPSQRDRRTEELVQLVGLSMVHLHHYPHELSGGQRQRIGIARALAMSPEVVIADEPVSALDVSLQGQIVNLLMELKDKLGLTIVLISHDLAVVRNVSDITAVMFGGRVVEYGHTEDIIADPQHPYTQELIAAVPKGIPARGERVPGDVAPEENMDHAAIEGCPYAIRCVHVMEVCRRTLPARTSLKQEHWTICHLHAAERL